MDMLAQISADFPWGVGLFLVVLGACLGSFLTMATYRLPLDQPIGRTRSRCPRCNHTLRARDLVPVLSWALARGKCRHCGTRVGARYPLTELACAGVCAGIYSLMGLSPATLCLMGLGIGIVAIVVTDLEHRIILDEVQVLLFFLGMLYGVANASAEATLPHVARMLGHGAFGIAIGLTLKYGFIYFMNKDGLGMGDVKFLGVVGVWLATAHPSLTAFVPFLFYSGVLGIVTALLWKCVSEDEHFPFGPALAFSLLLCVLWPESIRQFFLLYGILPLTGPSPYLST